MKLFEERSLYGEHAQVLSVDAVLHEARSRYQDVLVFRNATFGKVLALDGIVQLTEADHHIYHEMLVHVPLLAHGAAIDVLILGGGDGGALREVLKHPVRRVVLVEIDPEVIAVSQRHFADVSGGAFNDPRVEVLNEDAAGYVGACADRFDVIIVDSTDPIGPGEVLFSDAFYQRCRTLLRPSGLMSLQSGAPFFQPDVLQRVRSRVAKHLGAAREFLAPVPTYARGLLPLILAGAFEPSFCPSVSVLRARAMRINGPTRFYSAEVHLAAFALAPRLAPPGSDGRHAAPLSENSETSA